MQTGKAANDIVDTESSNLLKEDESRLFTLHHSEEICDIDAIFGALRRDQVVLVPSMHREAADKIIVDVAERLGVRNQLEMQTVYASVHGHRSSVGNHFMTVNKREDYQFISPHSEGQRSMNMQLAALYCYENSTDGGESILMNTNSSSPMWERLRALVTKVDLRGRKLSPAEIALAKMMYKISIPEDLLRADDHVVSELECPVPGVKMFDVLVKPQKSYSHILDRDVHVYWDNVASTDFDSGEEYLRLLRHSKLLKMPPGGLGIEQIDNAYYTRVYRSGVNYASLFNGKITRKLAPGDLLIQNNLTWTHSTSNWTPGSGNRKVVAAFA